MKPDRIAGLLAAGLTLVACSPEEPSRDPVPRTPGAAIDAPKDVLAGRDVPTAKAVPPMRPAAEPEPRVDPDRQVGVELPTPPVRVPENPPAE